MTIIYASCISCYIVFWWRVICTSLLIHDKQYFSYCILSQCLLQIWIVWSHSHQQLKQNIQYFFTVLKGTNDIISIYEGYFSFQEVFCTLQKQPGENPAYDTNCTNTWKQSLIEYVYWYSFSIQCTQLIQIDYKQSTKCTNYDIIEKLGDIYNFSSHVDVVSS